MELPSGSVGQWPHSFASGCLGEADRVAVGDDDVGVVEEPVDGGVGDRLRHQFVEPGRVKVRRQRDRPFLLGGLSDGLCNWV